MDTRDSFSDIYSRPLFGFIIVVFTLVVDFSGFPLEDEALGITVAPILVAIVIVFLLGGIILNNVAPLLFMVSLVGFLAMLIDAINIFNPLSILIGVVCVSMAIVSIFNANIASIRKNTRFFPRLIWELLMPIAVALGICSILKEWSLFLLCVSFLLLLIQMHMGRLYNYGYRKLLYSK